MESPKHLRRILPARFQQNFRSSRMLRNELCDVVDVPCGDESVPVRERQRGELTFDDDPSGFVAGVFCDFLGAVGLRTESAVRSQFPASPLCREIAIAGIRRLLDDGRGWDGRLTLDMLRLMEKCVGEGKGTIQFVNLAPVQN